MAYVLTMPAFQIGDPIDLLVLMESDDFALHPCAALERRSARQVTVRMAIDFASR